MQHEQQTLLHRATWVLTTIGALNWGFVGLGRFDLVRALFGRDTFLSRLVYSLVGIAGLYSAYRLANVLTRRPTRLAMPR